MQHRTPTSLWETALGQLELQVTPANFDTWLRGTVGLQLNEDHLVVGVPSDFALEWLRSRMGGPVTQTVSRLLGSPVSVAFQVLGAPQTSAPRPAVDGRTPETPPAFPRPELDPGLTFESFAVVKGNRMAFRAASQFASGHTRYSSLVLVGPPGLGKTHLLHAIGHEAVAAGRSVAALTSEAFVNLYTSAVRRGEPHAFRERFHGCDLLLLDDLPFLATRTKSQDQFFHMFNTLHGDGGRVVITTDTPPGKIVGLSGRLRSRLLAGLSIELSAPSASERLELLRSLSEQTAPPLPDDIIRAIANEPYASVRELQGALHRVAAYTELSEDPPSFETVAHALQTLAPKHQITPQSILDLVCRHFHLPLDEISGPSRSRDVTFARHIAMYLLRAHAPNSLSQIGHIFGGRDHSTVLSACKRIEQERASLPETRVVVDELEAELSQQAG